MTTFILRRNTDRNPTIAKVAAFLEALGDRCDWGVTVAPYKRTRTGEQNAYLWGVVYATIEKATGQEAEDWHTYFLSEHFGSDAVELFGRKKIKPRKRSSRLTTAEFADYIAFIQRRCAEHGIYIPDPA